jgi:hypothetical protein
VFYLRLADHVGSQPASFNRRLRITLTASADRAAFEILPVRSIGRNSGPSTIPEASIQHWSALTGANRSTALRDNDLSPFPLLIGLALSDGDDHPLLRPNDLSTRCTGRPKKRQRPRSSTSPTCAGSSGHQRSAEARQVATQSATDPNRIAILNESVSRRRRDRHWRIVLKRDRPKVIGQGC